MKENNLGRMLRERQICPNKALGFLGFQTRKFFVI